MAWDRAGESHEDQTMFGLIPEDETGRRGLLLRDRGYAEKAPVAGQFRMDDENGLILTTDYEMMSSLERFWFASENVRLRTSTVQGLSNNASFCIETRQLDDVDQTSPVMTSNGAAPLPPSAGKQKYLEKVLRHVIAATAAEGGKTEHFYDRPQWML